MSSITIDTSAKGDHDTNNKPSSTITSDTVIMKKSLLSNNSRNNTSQHFNFPGLKIPTGGFKMSSSSSSSSGGEVAAKARAAARVAARAALNVVIGIGNEVYSTEEEELDDADDVAAEATPQEEKEKEEEETKKKQEEEEKEYKKAVEKLRALEELRSEMNTSYHSSSMVSTSSQEDTLEEEEKVTTRTVSLPTVENATVLIAAPLHQEQEEQAYVPHKKTKTTTITNDDFINNNNNSNSATVVDLDEIDLDKITVHDLQGLTGDDGDILRAKHLNKLSRVEREHVLQDIHGVAEFPIMDNNFIDASLKKLSIELKSELLSRQKNNTLNNSTHTVPPPQAQQEEATQTQPAALPVLEEKLGELQRKLKELVGCRSNSNDSSYQGNVFKMDCPSSVQRNHNLHNIGGAMSIPSGLFSNFNSSNNVPSTTTRATGTSTKTKATTAIEDEALQDDAILKSSKAAAYEQALAQCRGRRRERRSSLFRHNALYGNLYQDEDNNDDYDSTRYLDVESRDFLLPFLRCERFDYKKAALRIFDYFEEKKSLFGLDFLTTRIQLKDLDIDTKHCLDSGYIQLLPGRDRAGRAVIVGTKKLIAPYDRDDDNTSALRALWFVSSVALEDAGTETKGVVFVYYALGNGSDASSSPSNHGNDRRLRRIDGWGNILRAIPLRIASIHWCVDTFQDKKVVNLSALMLGASNFVRVRCHAGTDTEVHYDLMTFGIPTSLLPVTMNGNIDLSQHRDFLQQRKQLGATSVLNQALAVIDAPVIDDCIALVEDDVDGVVKDAAKTNNNNDGGATWDLVDTYFHQQKQAQQQQRDNNMTINNNNNNNNNNNDSFMYSSNSNNNSMNNSMDNTMGSMHMMNRPMQVQSHPIQIESGMHHVQEQQQQQQQLLVNQFQQQQQLRLDQMMHQQQYLSQQHQFQQLQQLQSYGTTTANTSNTKKMKKSKNNDRNDSFSFCREPVLVPRESDILLGRGLGVQNRKGNVNYRYVVESFRSRYEKITQKGAKTQLIREVVECIHSKGGRFVKQDSYGRWIPVDPQIARDKVSHSFRNQKRLSLLPDGSDDDIYVKNKNKKKRSRNGMKSMSV